MDGRTFLCAACLWLCAGATAQTTGVGDNHLSVAEKEAGFRLLFNGADLDGWRGDDRYWEVRDGMLVGRHDGSLERNTFLIYRDEEFSNFVLRATCLLQSGNSGIQYRSEAQEEFRVIGYQADMSAPANPGARTWWGCLYGEGLGLGVIADGWPGKAETVLRPQDWNEYEVVARGDRLIQRLNGLTTADVRNDLRKSGVIALQLHTGGPMQVFFKNVRIKALGPDDPLPPETPGVPAGWTPLFDGTNLDQWDVVGNPAGFVVAEGGILRSEAGKGGQWLRSKSEYGDFILHVEWKVSPGGNSGVFIRAKAEGPPWVTGHEIQISNEQPPRDAMHCTGSLYGTVPADPRPDESPDVWHTYEIHALGSRITVIVDGKRTVNVDAKDVPAIANKPLAGYVGLQDSHAPPPRTIEYRNVWIRELTPE